MSPTTAHLRERMARELDTLEPMPDVVPAATRQGAGRLRRRRLAAGAALTVAGVAVTAAMTGGRSAPDATVVDDAQVANETQAPDPDLIAEAAADGVVTDAEWEAAVRATFQDLLPTRFGGVALHEAGDVMTLRTADGDPRMEIWLAIQGYDGPRSAQPGTSGCDGIRQVAAEQPFRWDILDCADGEFGPGFTVLATSEYSVGGDSSDTPGVGVHGSAVVVVNKDFFLEIGLSSLGVDAAVDLSAREMADLVQTPEFLDLAELGTTYFADLSARPDSVTVQPPDPVWPNGAS